MAKSRTDEIAERLHAAGVRKRVARLLADAQSRVPGGGEPPQAVQKALSDLRGLLNEVEDRVTGGAAKRQEAAQKAAASRKRNEAKRSAAAKKAAATRKRNAAAKTGTTTRATTKTRASKPRATKSRTTTSRAKRAT